MKDPSHKMTMSISDLKQCSLLKREHQKNEKKLNSRRTSCEQELKNYRSVTTTTTKPTAPLESKEKDAKWTKLSKRMKAASKK